MLTHLMQRPEDNDVPHSSESSTVLASTTQRLGDTDTPHSPDSSPVTASTIQKPGDTVTLHFSASSPVISSTTQKLGDTVTLHSSASSPVIASTTQRPENNDMPHSPGSSPVPEFTPKRPGDTDAPHSADTSPLLAFPTQRPGDTDAPHSPDSFSVPELTTQRPGDTDTPHSSDSSPVTTSTTLSPGDNDMPHSADTCPLLAFTTQGPGNDGTPRSPDFLPLPAFATKRSGNTDVSYSPDTSPLPTPTTQISGDNDMPRFPELSPVPTFTTQRPGGTDTPHSSESSPVRTSATKRPGDSDAPRSPNSPSLPAFTIQGLGDTDFPWYSKSSPVPTFKIQRHVDIDASQPPDFTIMVKGDTIPVHRNVLEETCHYFGCLFECGIQEAQTGTLEVKAVNPSAVKTIILYLYGEEISIEWDDIIDYIDLVEMWQLTELKHEIDKYMATNLDVNCSIPCMLNVAEKYCLEKLERKILSLDLDAPTKLRVCTNLVQTDDPNHETLYIDRLHRFKLTQCNPEFIETVLKNTFSDDEFATLKPYLATLSQLCKEYTLEEENKEHACQNTSERDSGSSESIDKGPDNQNQSDTSQNRLGKHGYTFVCPGPKDMICKFDFNTEMTDVSVKEIGRFLSDFSPVENCIHCLTPYGMFSCRPCFSDKSTACVLLDISSHNYIRLPKMPDYARYPVALCVNGVVYVLYMKRENTTHENEIHMKHLDLQNPTHWHSCPPASASHQLSHRSNEVIDACCVGKRIYVFCFKKLTHEIIDMSCHDTKSKTWSKSFQSSLLYSRLAKVVVADHDILLLMPFDGNAKYSTILDSWSTPPMKRFVSCYSKTEMCCVGKHLFVFEQGSDKLRIYDIHRRREVRSFTIPWSMPENRYIDSIVSRIWNVK